MITFVNGILFVTAIYLLWGAFYVCVEASTCNNCDITYFTLGKKHRCKCNV